MVRVVLLLFSVENVCEVLTLTVDGKNGVVSTGELTVFLDGVSFDLQHNGNPTTASSKSTAPNPNLTSDLQRSGCLSSVCLSPEVHQNGDAFHENPDESSARTQNRWESAGVSIIRELNIWLA